jgi:hypothetical protein
MDEAGPSAIAAWRSIHLGNPYWYRTQALLCDAGAPANCQERFHFSENCARKVKTAAHPFSAQPEKDGRYSLITLTRYCRFAG